METIKERIKIEEQIRRLKEQQEQTQGTQNKQSAQQDDTPQFPTHEWLRIISYALAVVGCICLVYAAYLLMSAYESEYNIIQAGTYAGTGAQFIFYGAIGKCLHDIREALIGKK